MLRRRLLAAVPLLGVALAVSALRAEEPVPARVPGTIRIVGDPDGIGDYAVVPAFPNLRFEKPLWVGAPPDGTDRLFVLEQDGRVRTFPNDPDVASAEVALDLTRQVLRSHSEEGLLGMAFHPRFAENREVFLFYSAGNPRRDVISRFEMDRSRKRILPESEKVLLEVPQPWGNHNGGGIEFGPDGYLYLSFGDGGSANDPRGTGQDNSDLLATILRIDPDHGDPYAIPRDNPFVGVKGVRPEIWAYGLRNVWRFSFDSATGALWAGDVGQVTWEEVDLVVRGGNYGWNLREGPDAFRPGPPPRTPPIEPVVSIPRSEGRSITGGVVYRGRQHADLVGAYLYADYETGNVWALRHDGQKVVANRLIARGRNIASFGEDRAREVYLACFDGRIHTLRAGRARPAATFPRRLSQTGLFTDTARLVPHASLVPYDVNVPLWSGGTSKERHVMLPGLERIDVAADGTWTFPVGTIFVKTFFLGDEVRGAKAGKRIETRLLVRRPDGWAGFTYVWDDAQRDAELADSRITKTLPAHPTRPAGPYTIPSRSDCLSCHTEAGGRVLGFRPEQLDRTLPDGTNALDALERRGLFRSALVRRPAYPDWRLEPKDLDRSVRTYLEANCVFCHRTGAPGNSRIDLRADLPLEATHLLEPPGQGDLGVAGARLLVPGDPSRSLLLLRMQRTDEKGMPNLSHDRVDDVAVSRLAAWIRTLR